MKRQPKKKSLNNAKDCKNKIEYLIKNKMDFQLLTSNYTTEIVCKEVPFFNIKYLQKPQNNMVFIAFQKIKKDLITWTANEMPIINKRDVQYFDYSKTLKPIKDSFCKNMDLTAAYATILLNDCFIQKETFDFIMRLPKLDRLACIGMLASHKDIFTYQNGKVILHDEINNPLENYFYYCVDRTSQVMEYIKTLIKKDFIFTWVDSVYYHDPTGVNTFYINNYLQDQGLKGKFQDLRFLNINIKPEYINISFFDEKAVKLSLEGLPNKPKVFNISTLNNSLKKDILHHFNLI